jgi:hypothetical protein
MPGDQNNLMKTLKNLSIIDYNMFSIYMKKEDGNKSNIIFGGYDLKGISVDSRDLKKIKTILTVDSSTWAVRMKSLTLGEKHVFNFTY